MIDPAHVQRHGQLCMMTSKELGEMLAQKGYQCYQLSKTIWPHVLSRSFLPPTNKPTRKSMASGS